LTHKNILPAKFYQAMSIEEDIAQLEIKLAQNTNELEMAGLIMDFIKTNYAYRNIKGEPYVEMLFQLAEKTDSVYHRAWSAYYLAAFYNFTAKYDEAQNLSHKALRLFEQIGDDAGLGNTYNNLGVIYM
jgi:hypothetical protein